MGIVDIIGFSLMAAVFLVPLRELIQLKLKEEK